MSHADYDSLRWRDRYGRPPPKKRLHDGQKRVFDVVRSLPAELKNKSHAAVARQLKDQFSDLSPASIETYVRKARSGK